jgi:hypothetical protein
MASSDSELIEEVRALTDYDESVYSDEEIQELVDIGKSELRSKWNEPELDFYTSERSHVERALFWFTCIATKVRIGEIASMNIRVESFEATKPGNLHYDYWFRNFQQHMRDAYQNPGPSSTVMSRTDRSYGG